MERGRQRMETVAVHSGERRPGPEGSVIFPIYQGTIFTVEPGIYIPEEGIGVRLEDDILITTDGVQVLSAQLPQML